MRHRVRLAEAGHEHVRVERHAGDEVAVERVAHLKGARLPGISQHGVAQAEPVERAKDVGPELDAGADLAELRALLEDAYRKTLARERDCRGETADAAAGDHERLLRPAPRHAAAAPDFRWTCLGKHRCPSGSIDPSMRHAVRRMDFARRVPQ